MKDDTISRQAVLKLLYALPPEEATTKAMLIQSVKQMDAAQSEQDREFMKLTVKNSNGRPYYSIIFLEFDDNGIGHDFEGYSSYSLDVISDYLKKYFMPSAQPEPPFEIQDILDYLDTALHPIISPEHWGVYSELHDMISTLPSAQPEQRWTPCSKGLPKKRDWYLGIFKESDTGWINPVPFVCDYLLGKKTKATTKEGWILKGFTDGEEHIDYYFNLECVAWMPLPEPFKGGVDDV